MIRNKTLLTLAILAALGMGSAWAATQSQPANTAAAKSVSDAPARASLDKNGDGVIDRAEAGANPRLAQHFDTLDKNKDGKLSADERPQRDGRRHGRGFGGRDGGGQWKQLDTNQDGRISQAEAAAQPGFQQRFAQMDANGDGYLDKTDRELRGKQRRDEWFAKADTDKDGKLSRAEMDASDVQRREEFQKKMQARGAERFAALDSNKDGRISRDEAKDKGHLAERFDQLDSNKDGALSQDELQAKRRQ